MPVATTTLSPAVTENGRSGFTIWPAQSPTARDFNRGYGGTEYFLSTNAAEEATGNKASFLIGLGQQIASGQLDLDRVAGLPTPAAVEELVRLRGVGRWTAEFLLMRALGRADALPANDAGVRQGVAAVYGQRLPEAELRAFGQRWQPWGGMAALYLLAWLREEAEAKSAGAM